MQDTSTPDLTMPLFQQWTDIREGTARICAPFDNAYWTKLDQDSVYPSAFVKALTEAGYLAATPSLFFIPPDTPPGEYQLRGGAYRADTGRRLKTKTGTDPIQDWVVLSTILIEP